MVKFVVAKLPALPVVFWFSVGNVQLVSVPEAGVPSAGVTSVGLLDKTTEPVPVEDVTPVPPLETGSVPVTWLVKLTLESVPPNVRLPEEVTVPESVIPLTVPVPETEVTEPPGLDDAMVIPPAEFVMVTFDPAVKVAFVRVLPVELPISN